MRDGADTQPMQGRGRIVGTATVQLVVAVAACVWALWLSNDAAEQEAALGSGFWGLAALACFFGMLAVMNVVFPLLRFSFPTARPQSQRLAFPLQSIRKSVEVARELFGLGVAFLAPAVPLACMTWNLSASRSHWTLLGVGATLIRVLVGGLLLLMTTRQLYTRLVGGDSSTALDKLPVRPGDNQRLVVSYVPGRLDPTRIRVRVVCLQTGRTYRRPTAEGVLGSRTSTKREVYAAMLHAEEFEERPMMWEYDRHVAIPDEALLSDATDLRSVIDWFLEVDVAFARAPDVTLCFHSRWWHSS